MASSENKNGYYQSIKKYDGSDPTYFPAFIAAVTDHYATWRNGEEVQGIWHEHIREGGVCIEEPSVLSDELYLAHFTPHLMSGRVDTLTTRSPQPGSFTEVCFY